MSSTTSAPFLSPAAPHVAPQLLVSVRSADEAQLAVAAGVDLIDVKEPRLGSLGAAATDVVSAVAAVVAGRVPVSMACGELIDERPGVVPPGVRLAKIGLAGCARLTDWRDRWCAWAASLPPGVSPVAVCYADWQAAHAPAPDEVQALAATERCAALLIDTFDKSRGDLLAHLDTNALARLITRTRLGGLASVLAGSLTLAALEHILPLEPDFIAVRGAVCATNRTGTLDPERLQHLVDKFSNVE